MTTRRRHPAGALRERRWAKGLTRRVASVLGTIAPERSAEALRNPFFIVGSGRSGTTMLREVLAYHPRVAAYPSEANDLRHPRTYPWHQSSVSVPPIWLDPVTFTEISREHWSERDARRIRSVFGAYQRIQGGDRFLGKTVMVNFMLPELLSIFPDARLIHMVRDGRAVAISYARKELGKISSEPAYHKGGVPRSFEDLVPVFAEYWQRQVEEIAHQRDALSLDGRMLDVRYEAFCADPRRELGRLATFMNVEAKPFDFSNFDRIANRAETWREHVSAAMAEELTRSLGPWLRRYGYHERDGSIG